MGCDGGSIAKRDDVVKMKKKPEKVNQSELDESRWFRCTLLQDPLSSPIVADDLGNLFNKANVIQALLDGSLAQTSSLAHIKSLKSIYTVNFIDNPSYEEQSKHNVSVTSGSNGDSQPKKIVSPWICPITKTEVGGHQQRFSLIRTCGHVLSEKALKEVDSNICFTCSNSYDAANDIIILNPSPEELVVIKENLLNGTDNNKE
eukprot:gene10573-12300_t